MTQRGRIEGVPEEQKPLSLVERLRDHENEGVTGSDRFHLRNEAAEEIERLSALDQPDKGQWIAVSERLPELEAVVLVCYASGYDGSPIYAWGGRVDDSEGWLWGIGAGIGGSIHPKENSAYNDIEADDDYKVTHWMPLPPPPDKGHVARASTGSPEANSEGNLAQASSGVIDQVAATATEVRTELAIRKAFDEALDFIEDWSNWWSYALEKPDGSAPTAEDDQKAHDLGDRASRTVIEGRRLLKRRTP